LAGLLFVLCLGWSLSLASWAQQHSAAPVPSSAPATHESEFQQELSAGRQAWELGDYAGAQSHFEKANALHNGNCSECYVFLLRLEMSQGDLGGATRQAERAVATAADGQEAATAQLYRAIIFARKGEVANAESALRAAVASNPECGECRFNLGFLLLQDAKDVQGVNELKSALPFFAGTLKEREILRFIASPARAREHFAPEFSALASNGESINLDTLEGKVVVLDFWGAWCAPCQATLPVIKQLAGEMDPQKVAIVSVDEGDARTTWNDFVRRNGMSWTQVYDGDGQLKSAFAVDDFPRYVILTKTGLIQEKFSGSGTELGPRLRAAIAMALQAD